METLFERCARKFPLATAARVLFERALAPETLNELFEQTAQEQYTRVTLFSDLVNLMGSVVHRVHRSLHAAFQDSALQACVSQSTIYDKINNLEPQVSAEFVRKTTERIIEVTDHLQASLPPLVPGYETRILDGNAIAATDHRLEVLRDTRSGPLPGKSLAFYDYERDMIREIIPCEDGHAQERSLSDEILERVKPKMLTIADRNFCTAKLLVGIDEREGSFIIRQHRSLPFSEETPLAPVSSENARLKEGTVIVTFEGKNIRLRRICLSLPNPTRDGDLEIFVLTNVPPEDASAELVMECYRKRWKLETTFATLTTTIRCEVPSLGYPRAALFTFSTAAVAANLLAGIRLAIRAGHGIEKEECVSTYHLLEGLRSSAGSLEVIDNADHDWGKYAKMDINEFTKIFLEIVARFDLNRYRKAKTRPRAPRRIRGTPDDPPHVSTHRLLQTAKK
jgi:hypothetical protein